MASNNYKFVPVFGDAKVPGKSHKELESYASTVRVMIHELGGNIKTGILKALDQLNELGVLSYEVVDDSTMNEGMYAYTVGDHIKIKESIFDAAGCKDNPEHKRQRFTISHEICHALLHRDIDPGFARQTPPKAAFESAEWQANTFAGYLLASRKDLIICQYNPNLLSEHVNISYQAAEIIIKNYKRNIL